MNWQRGFLRLWCVFTLLWVIGMTMLLDPVISYKQMQMAEGRVRDAAALLAEARHNLEVQTSKTETLGGPSEPGAMSLEAARELAILNAKVRRFEALAVEVGERLDRSRGTLIENFGWIFLPPVVLLILGLMVRWIIRGFTTGRA